MKCRLQLPTLLKPAAWHARVRVTGPMTPEMHPALFDIALGYADGQTGASVGRGSRSKRWPFSALPGSPVPRRPPA